MSKKNISRVCLVLAILTVTLPYVLQHGFGVRPRYIFGPITTTIILDSIWFFVASGFLLLATAMQFPFREEEAWHCECGYDLSYLNKKSSRCPECGRKVQLEWSPNPGEYSRKTTRRFHFAVLLFMVSISMSAVGLLLQMFRA